MEYLLSTGIAGLDELLKGGFLPGQKIVVAGTPGAGKSTIGASFIYNGIIKGEEGLIVLTNQTEENFCKVMRSVGYDFTSPELKDKCHFVELSLDEEKKVNAKSIIEISKSINAKRVVFDTISFFDTQYDNYQEKNINLLKSMQELSKAGRVTLWLDELPSEEKLTFSHAHFISDGIIVLKHIMHKAKYSRMLSVLKLRGVWHDDRFHPFEITDKGIKVYPKDVSL